MKVEAAFVRSAASASDLPRDGLPELVLVGRSNVGKSSLINALVRQRLARTSAAPGKTRLANLYRVARVSTLRQAQGRPEHGRGATGSGRSGKPFYLVDLPGYGYARGGRDSAREFEELTRAYFGREEPKGQEGREFQERRPVPDRPARLSALLLVDARHPGLENDREAWHWLQRIAGSPAIVATKIDKLSRAERLRAMRSYEAVFEHRVLPVSAVTGEGLEELWKLIERLTRCE
jgi:GTP-binding protein